MPPRPGAKVALPVEPFVHLHVHTEYSLLDGANPIGKLADAAVEDGHDALAITDHGNLFGAMEFYKACRKRGVKPILGCEVYIAQDSMHKPHSRRDNPYTHLTLLARDAEGWRNLMQLSSASYLEGLHFRPRIDMAYLAGRTDGITCLSGCMSGPVNRLLRQEDEDGARAMAGRLQDMFGKEHFFLEVMRNGIAVQDKLTESMARMRHQVDAPLVATNDIHYLRHEDCAVQDAMLCLHTGSKVADPDRWRMDSDTLYFRSREEMNRIFSDLPEALRNTQVVADQIDVELEIGRLRLPVFQPDDGSTPEKAFRRLCEEGYARLYPGNPSEARERMEFEMKVITEMGFVSYFLIVWDLVRHAQEQGIPVGPGRGSAAGSLVAYVLGITRIDPLAYDLLFERFLNPSRISMPDIDIDFCKDRREEMIEYTRRRYGDENVCQIITFGKLKAKNALRDMGRVLDVPLAEVDKVAKKIPDGPKVTLASALEDEPELVAMRDATPESRQWFELAGKVEGLSRNAGVHAAGVIIADQPLHEIVPLARVSGNVTTQWDMKYSEEFGLLKMDFLGLRTLTILDEAAKLVEQRHGERPDLDGMPLDDEATYALLRAADTEGVFQLESSGMRRLLADIKPTSYDDIVAVLALFRPGPLGSGLHETYARRKHGEEAVSYDHPLLEEILDSTYGVLIYQEQIMRVAQRMGGFSLADADSLRKAMGKKNAKLMSGFEKQFLDGAAQREVPAEVAKDIWDMMVKFAEYGFNKSHSTGYAMVTYQAAWLKAHYPAEFYAASFTHEAHDTDKLRTLVEDARRHDIRVLPPCINRSDRRFAVVSDEQVRFGLGAIKGVGSGAAEALVELRGERKEGGFPDLDELLIDGVAACQNKALFEGLTRAGALDVFGEPRGALIARLEERMRWASGLAKDRARGQGMLFGGPAPEAAAAKLPDGGPQVPEDSTVRRRQQLEEKEALGVYLTSHPLDEYRAILGGVSPWDSRSIREAPDESLVALAGIAVQLQVRPTRKDPSKKLARLRVEDLLGATPAVVFPRTWEELAGTLEEDFIGLFHGKVQRRDDGSELIIDRVEPLGRPEDIALRGSLVIRLDAASPPLEHIQELLRAHSGEAAVRFVYRDPEGRERVIRADKTQWAVHPSSALVDALERLLGPGSASLVMEKRARPAPKPAWAR